MGTNKTAIIISINNYILNLESFNGEGAVKEYIKKIAVNNDKQFINALSVLVNEYNKFPKYKSLVNQYIIFT